VPALVEGLRARERHRQNVAGQFAGARQAAPARVNASEVREELRHRLKHWRRLLLRNVSEARGLSRFMLSEPIMLTPEVDGELHGYRYRACVHVRRLSFGGYRSNVGGVPRRTRRSVRPAGGRLVRRVTSGLDDLQADRVLERIEVTIAVQQ
jgi:hypothetical protein